MLFTTTLSSAQPTEFWYYLLQICPLFFSSVDLDYLKTNRIYFSKVSLFLSSYYPWKGAVESNPFSVTSTICSPSKLNSDSLMISPSHQGISQKMLSLSWKCSKFWYLRIGKSSILFIITPIWEYFSMKTSSSVIPSFSSIFSLLTIELFL